ncbi:MAG: phage integrase SAM-like domain-containing protein [Bacteroidaceae bacterium]|nr:phage integrase SAM-like domain-containing protein [Bacteroidaceae bacterium]
MAIAKIYLDTRRAKADGCFPVKIYIYHRDNFFVSTGISASLGEWDTFAGCFKARSVADKQKNIQLRNLLTKIETLLFNLELTGELSQCTDKQLSTKISALLGTKKADSKTLTSFLDKGAVGKSQRTQRLFKWCKDRVAAFDAKVQIADVSKKWLADFQRHLEKEGYAVNSVALLLSYVARACSIAHAEGYIRANPAVGYRKPKQETRKRSLSVEVMRQLRDKELSGYQEWARDMFFLSFYLIGINTADLYDLKELRDGRVEYKRHKTGTLYSVAVPPEAAAIIEKYKGDGKLIDTGRFTSSGTMGTSLTHYLRQIHPDLTTYYARHTWATLAAELDIPIETISHALGHKIGSPVTAIYVAYNQRKIDEANRKVIDYINADKKD